MVGLRITARPFSKSAAYLKRISITSNHIHIHSAFFIRSYNNIPQTQHTNSNINDNNMVLADVPIMSEHINEKRSFSEKVNESLSSSTEAIKDDNNTKSANGGRREKLPKKTKRKAKKLAPEPTTPLGVLLFKEIPELCQEFGLTEQDITNNVNSILNEPEAKLKYNRDVQNVKVLRYTSNGDGLALIDHPDGEGKKQVVIIPFAMPGDVVDIRIFMTKHTHVEADLLKVTSSGEFRDDSLIRCKYFGVCSGCQYQQIEYDQQLIFKQNTIINAFKYFAPRLTSLGKLPSVGPTVSSPLDIGYRTKLTPHYEMKKFRDSKEVPNFGFGNKGRPEWRPSVPQREYPGGVMDIEDCIIGTEIIRKGMKNERDRLEHEVKNTENGVKHKATTVLLREDTKYLKDLNDETKKLSLIGTKDITTGEITTEIDETKGTIKTCVTDNNAIVSEIVGGLRFDFVANEFFQNNNSILPKVLKYVQDNLGIESSEDGAKENYLVDAYCGSGLFSISLAKSVTKSLGVEISAHSIKFAKRNVELNNITNCSFIEGKAEELFKSIDFPRDQTSVILDPPRKGCDDVFLSQLSDFYPRKIVYVSCNVHSQARDIEYFINETANGDKYEVESICGFDFFPQTHHVEGVAVLKRK